MEKITTVGLDLAKQVLAAHAVGGDGRMVTRTVLWRDQPLRWTATLPRCVVAMEARGGAHDWARELTRQGHTMRIIAVEFARSFRKSGKNVPCRPPYASCRWHAIEYNRGSSLCTVASATATCW